MGLNGEFTIRLSSLFISQAEESLGKYFLLSHQKEMRDADNRLIILDAPTGSGKTLGILSRILNSSYNAILVYPTNELIKDQARQLKEYLTSIGYNPRIYFSLQDQEQTETSENPIVNVFVFNSYELEELSELLGTEITTKKVTGVAKGKIIRYLLTTKTSTDVYKNIILTNPDSLYLLTRLDYAYGPNLLKLLTMNRFRILALDEFHMYSGIPLANLFIILRLLRQKFKQIIISTATVPTKAILDILLKYLDVPTNQVRILKATSTSEPMTRRYRKIRYDSTLKIRTIPSNGFVLCDKADLLQVVQDVKQLYERYKNEKMLVKILVIVNSVIFAERLRKELLSIFDENEVGAVHGFIPSDKRILKPITVGTSSIEIGVDFDVPALIFDATSQSSFIQRLGRGGRHSPCEAIAYVNMFDFAALKKRLESFGKSNGLIVDYNQFVEIIQETLGEEDFYVDFIATPDKPFWYLVFAFIIRKLSYYYRKNYLSYKKLKDEVEKVLLDEFSTLLGLGKNYISYIVKGVLSCKKKGKCYGDFGIIVALEKATFRSSPTWLPAIYGDSVTTVSISDLNKTHFTLIHPDELSARIKDEKMLRNAKKLLRRSSVSFFVNIKNLERYLNIIVTPLRWLSSEKVSVITSDSVGVSVNNPELAEALRKLISEEIGIIASKRDWRLNSLPVEKWRNQHLIIGPDALLIWNRVLKKRNH